jgi:hypothetical protein
MNDITVTPAKNLVVINPVTKKQISGKTKLKTEIWVLRYIKTGDLLVVNDKTKVTK